MADTVITIVIPNVKAVDNGDGTYSVSVKDVNSDAILAALT
jgi:hypothetical protein